MVVVHMLIIAIGAAVIFYGLIGAIYIHGTRYDYSQSVENCRELVNANNQSVLTEKE